MIAPLSLDMPGLYAAAPPQLERRCYRFEVSWKASTPGACSGSGSRRLLSSHYGSAVLGLCDAIGAYG